MPPVAGAPPADAVASAAALLRNAKQPVILAGRVSRDVDAWNARIALAERLIEGLPEALRDWPGLPEATRTAAPAGISIGIAANEDGPLSPDMLAARADAALYEAKRTGKNRACTASRQPALR
jgi:PleD family two-component response regulator